MLTRRSFLRASALTIGAVGAAPSWLLRAAAQGQPTPKILVAIFQRGAADGLNIVVPFFEPRYYQVRPGIAIPSPGKPGGGLDLDGRFALHPALQPLKALWDDGQLAIVHAAGSHDPSRSHFDAQDYMESGTPGSKREDGWLDRALPPPGAAASPVRAIASGAQLPRTLRGNAGAVAVDNLSRFRVEQAETAELLEALYSTTADAELRAQGRATFDAVRMIETIQSRPYTPAAGAQYVGEFGQRLQQISRLIKADVGVEVAFADIGGWDHHSNENGQLTGLLRQFGSSLAAFTRDMGDRMEDIVIVTMSEFGRTVKENGNAGTDHGHGNVMLAMGGGIRGGQVYGEWPGLAQEQLFEGRDLAVTTDFRDVLGELVSGHIGRDTARVFPGHERGPTLGLLAESAGAGARTVRSAGSSSPLRGA
jgi:uncharacterized protein (DUF1501 family)